MHLRTLASLLALALGIANQVFADDVVDGRTGPGALYRLIRPTNWNGSLVLYAHGAVSPDAPVALPAEADVISGLLVPQGFAVAFSSFSENGWAVKDGAQRTHQLLGIFASTFGLPTRVYVGGASLGGLITLKLVEDHPGIFVGALPICAVAGGARRQLDYLGHTRALFDVFYPQVLPGSAATIPSGIDITQAIVLPAIAAMQSSPAGMFAIARITQTPIPFATPAELLQSVAAVLADHAASVNDLLAHTHGHPYFSNRDTEYVGALPPDLLAAINASVERFDASPSALEYLTHYDEPSGDLRLPMLMLSTSRDPITPGFHETAYRDAVAAAGHSDLLVQREIDRYGHCTFTPAELATAFRDLVFWVELGIKPAP
jgi:pimeloyl-ACP methyl ester carboxylesterase